MFVVVVEVFTLPPSAAVIDGFRLADGPGEVAPTLGERRALAAVGVAVGAGPEPEALPVLVLAVAGPDDGTKPSTESFGAAAYSPCTMDDPRGDRGARGSGDSERKPSDSWSPFVSSPACCDVETDEGATPTSLPAAVNPPSTDIFGCAGYWP